MSTEKSPAFKNIVLTKRVIDAARLPEGKQQLLIMDASLPGFGLRITANAKTFILNRRLNGQPIRHKIGRYGGKSESYGTWTVDNARKEARQLIVQMDKGEDPRSEKRRRRNEPTFKQLVEAFDERHASRKKSGKAYIEYIKCYSSDWYPKRLSLITHDVVAARHASLRDKPYSANRWLAMIRLMFNKAYRWDGFTDYVKDNPARGVEKYPEHSRTRFVTPEELPKILNAIDSVESIHGKAAILLTLWTAARPTEIYRMRWVDIDLKAGTWNKPQTKAGENHLVPLSSAAVTILDQLPRINEYVLPGQGNEGHMKSARSSWLQALEKSGLQDLRHRDLRRTMASWLAAQGESLLLIGKLLDHKTPQATAIYARLSLAPVRTALVKVTEQMEAARETRVEANGVSKANSSFVGRATDQESQA